MKIILHPRMYSVNLLASDAELQNWMDAELPLLSITRDRGAWTVVCPANHAEHAERSDSVQARTDWGCFEVAGTQELDVVGILAELADILRDAGISIYVLSSFTTDYLLVINDNIRPAVDALRNAGHEIIDHQPVTNGQ